MCGRKATSTSNKEKGFGLYIIMDEFVLFNPQRGFWSAELGWIKDLVYADVYTDPKSLVIGFSYPVELIPASECQLFTNAQLAVFVSSLIVSRRDNEKGLPKQTVRQGDTCILTLDQSALAKHLEERFPDVAALIAFAKTFISYHIVPHKVGRWVYIVPNNIAVEVAHAPKPRPIKTRSYSGRRK
jgi:hypothetical protein